MIYKKMRYEVWIAWFLGNQLLVFIVSSPSYILWFCFDWMVSTSFKVLLLLPFKAVGMEKIRNEFWVV